MNDQHPITPPPGLMKEWLSEFYGSPTAPVESTLHVATRASQWGADQELEACCALLEASDDNARDFLQSARRPKPPSLKQQALQELDKVNMLWATEEFGQETLNSLDTIRKALEALPDD